MYIYVQKDTRNIVKDYEHAEIDHDSKVKQWPMKFYDNVKNNPDLLETDGWVKTYLIDCWYSTFETYYDLFTVDSSGALRLPTNIPQPSLETLQAQMNAQAITTQKVIEDNTVLKAELAKKSGDE